MDAIGVGFRLRSLLECQELALPLSVDRRMPVFPVLGKLGDVQKGDINLQILQSISYCIHDLMA